MSEKSYSRTGPATNVQPGAAATAAPKPVLKPAASQGNPAFRAMGLPNWRPKLPSRNWLIFWTVVGSWTGALLYDRRMKKKEQQKWCTLVSHVAQESLPTNAIARKVTVYLASPPGDNLRVSREHFTEYVKPVLVAGGLDWEVVEGRREGELRAGQAERIRRLRRRNGEVAAEPAKADFADTLQTLRDRIGVQEWTGPKGDIILGRHAWKEYVRGVHEGWLGPLDPPKPPLSQSADETSNAQLESPAVLQEASAHSELHEDASPTKSDSPPDAEKPKEEPPKPETPAVTPPFNTPSSYPSSPLAPSIPAEFAASTPIALPHILGFRNTPIRLYRFLTRRYIADDVGRQTAAIVLATYRPYLHSPNNATNDGVVTGAQDDASSIAQDGESIWEQQRLLLQEESEWWKKSLQRNADGGEREWLDKMVMDERIGERMRKFELEPEDEERARRIRTGISFIPGRTARNLDEGKEEKA